MWIEFSYTPPDVPLKILHLDDQIIVTDKPEGLLSVPGKLEDMVTLEDIEEGLAIFSGNPLIEVFTVEKNDRIRRGGEAGNGRRRFTGRYNTGNRIPQFAGFRSLLRWLQLRVCRKCGGHAERGKH